VIKKLFIFLLFFLTAVPAQAAVIINEIFPKTESPVQSWVELYNTGNESVSLNLWKLDHTAGDAKSFILPAGMIIEKHQFLTLYQSQTAMTFSIDGDLVRLFNQDGALADQSWYTGTLGYNTSMGRSADGADGWVVCAPDPYASTPNAANNCPPAPTPMATPVLTPTPTPQPKADPAPRDTPTPTPRITPFRPPDITTVPTQQSFGSFLPSPTAAQVLGMVNTPIPTPTPGTNMFQFAVAKSTLAYILLGIAACALSLMLTLFLRRRR